MTSVRFRVRSRDAGFVAWIVVVMVMLNGSAANFVQLIEACNGLLVGWFGSQVFGKLTVAAVGSTAIDQVWSVFCTADIVLFSPCAAPSMIGMSLSCPWKPGWSKK